MLGLGEESLHSPAAAVTFMSGIKVDLTILAGWTNSSHTYVYFQPSYVDPVKRRPAAAAKVCHLEGCKDAKMESGLPYEVCNILVFGLHIYTLGLSWKIVQM